MSGTIYLPRAVGGIKALGGQLGNFAGNLAGQWNTSDALKQAEGMSPEEQLTYLTGRLGPQGMEFVKNLTDLKSAQANIARAGAETDKAKADTINVQAITGLNQDKLANAERIRTLEETEAKARIAASNAQAAGSYASAASHTATAEQARYNLETARRNQTMTDALISQKLRTATAEAAGAEAAVTPENLDLTVRARRAKTVEVEAAADVAKPLADVSVDAARANVGKTVQDTATGATNNKLLQDRLTNANDIRELEKELMRAQTEVAKANAAGSPAAAALHQAQADSLRQQIAERTRQQATNDALLQARLRTETAGAATAEAGAAVAPQGAAANVASTQATTALTTTRNALEQSRLKVADELHALEQQKMRADMAATTAATAGSNDLAAFRRMESQKIGVEIELKQKQMAMSDRLMDELLGPAAPAAPAAGTPGLKPIAAPGVSTTSPIISDSPQPRDPSKGFSSQLQTIQSFDAGNPIENTTTVNGQNILPPLQLKSTKEQMLVLSPADKAAVTAALSGNDMTKAMTLLAEGSQPKRVDNVEIAPGIFIKVGEYADGSTRRLPVPPIDKRTAPSEQEIRVATGAAQFATTSEILQELNDLADKPNGDVLGNGVVRRLDTWLQGHGFAPTGAAKDRSVKEMYLTIYAHNIIGLTALQSGLRQTQALTRQFQETMASPTDSVEIRNQKLRATALTADLIIKSEVETSIAGKKIVPPILLDLYKQRNLVGKDLDIIRREYIAAARAFGVKSPVDPVTGKETGKAEGATGAPGADMVTLGSSSMTRAAAETLVRARGFPSIEAAQKALSARPQVPTN